MESYDKLHKQYLKTKKKLEDAKENIYKKEISKRDTKLNKIKEYLEPLKDGEIGPYEINEILDIIKEEER